MKSLFLTSTAILGMLLSGCASNTANQAGAPDNDPLETYNRGMHKFNMMVDGLILEPAAHAYRVVPQPARNAVGNVLRNLSEPVTFVNAVLQGDANQAFTTFWRFVLNTTVGFGGIRDFAAENGLQHRKEDFGQTLGKWGVGSGPYLVLPLLGPSSFRDGPALVVDFFTDPFTYAWKDEEIIARRVVYTVHTREENIELLDDLEETSFDPYATLRSGYLQHREDLVRNGKIRTEYYY